MGVAAAARTRHPTRSGRSGPGRRAQVVQDGIAVAPEIDAVDGLPDQLRAGPAGLLGGPRQGGVFPWREIDLRALHDV